MHLLLLAAFALTTASATYTLEMQLLSYSNPGHLLANGSCCVAGCSPCQVRFKICRRDFEDNVANDQCPDAEVSFTVAATAEADDGSITFNATGQLYEGAYVFNPIDQSGPTWTGDFQLFIAVTEGDEFLDPPVIDQLGFDWVINPSLQWTQPQQVLGIHEVVTMEARARVFCNTNFYGSDCREFCVPRDDSGGHYTCNQDGSKVCLEGYTDVATDCITPICSPTCNPDNGFCNVPGECICKNGWSGENCDECGIPPGCSPEHGFCTAPNECLCQEGYSGENCDMDDDVCGHQQPCAAGSTCTSTGPNQYTCTCTLGFTGQNCDTETDECSPNPCQNGATCEDLFTDFQCHCAEGWTGETCHINIDDCNPNPCLNGGTCNDEVNGYSCSCPSGYLGTNCEDDHCDGSPCLNGATCNALAAGYECVCVTGYFGPDCGESECDSSPCNNGATCIPHIGSYECVCDGGFTGSDCETDIDECESSPCRNNGTCNNMVGSYECICPRGLEGANCESPISPACDRNPCASGLECVNQDDGGFVCQFCVDGSCRIVDPDFVVGDSPSPTLSANTEPASNKVLIGVLVALFLLLLVGASVATALIGYYFYWKQTSPAKEINPFNATNMGRMNVTDNPTYLPADDLVPDDDVVEKMPANGQSTLAEPVYASTAVKYPSMVPIITNVAYDTLATSHDNLLTPYSSYDRLGTSHNHVVDSSPGGVTVEVTNGHTATTGRRAPPRPPPPGGNATVAKGPTATGRRQPPPRPAKPPKPAKPSQPARTIVNPYASVDLGAITGSEIDLHNGGVPANGGSSSKAEYDLLEKV